MRFFGPKEAKRRSFKQSDNRLPLANTTNCCARGGSGYISRNEVHGRNCLTFKEKSAILCKPLFSLPSRRPSESKDEDEGCKSLLPIACPPPSQNHRGCEGKPMQEKTIERLSKHSNWRSAIDELTKKRYYYNKKTKEVSWDKPKDYIEWRVYYDRNSQKCYYYNISTKETTWNEPVEYAKATTTSNTGSPRQTESVTPKVSHTKKVQNDSAAGEQVEQKVHQNAQDDSLETRAGDSLTELNARVSKDVNQEMHSSLWKAYFDCASGEYFFFNLNTKERTWKKPKDFQEWIKVQSSSYNDFYFYNILTGLSTWTKPSLKKDEISLASSSSSSCFDEVSSAISTEQECSKDELQNLASQYCPDETYYTDRLMRKFRGQEKVPLQAIQSFSKCNVPFDEKNGAVASYVKAAVTPVGSEPYDEMLDSYLDNGNNHSLHSSKEVAGIKTTVLHQAPITSPPFHSGPSQILTTSAYSRYLSKPIYFVGSSGRTAMYMYR